jgi:heat shock protein HslJ
MNGEYELSGNSLTFAKVIATEMFCEDSQEQEFLKMLEEVQSFFFTNKGELILNLKLDSGSAILDSPYP